MMKYLLIVSSLIILIDDDLSNFHLTFTLAGWLIWKENTKGNKTFQWNDLPQLILLSLSLSSYCYNPQLVQLGNFICAKKETIAMVCATGKHPCNAWTGSQSTPGDAVQILCQVGFYDIVNKLPVGKAFWKFLLNISLPPFCYQFCCRA